MGLYSSDMDLLSFSRFKDKEDIHSEMEREKMLTLNEKNFMILILGFLVCL